jgi:ribonucleoside-diphosphate reductase alpha chain
MSTPAVSPSIAASPFIDAAAVEAWDAWFRWRCRGELRDTTVESSWYRVAAALATVESEDPIRWQQRFRDALGNWKLLPDPVLLRCAGTDVCDWDGVDLAAALNAAAFVRGAFTGWACFDHGAFRNSAELAVRMLDNALQLAAPGADYDPLPRLRIGLIGVADALALLGVPYASADGQAQAREMAALLAEGCLAGSVRLARERGPRLAFDPARQRQAERRGMPAELIADANRYGLRHAALTAIDSQPQLALLANNVSDALDPLGSDRDWVQIDAPGGNRRLRAQGFAHALRRRHLLLHGTEPPPAACQGGCIAEQILLRAAVAPWIDAPIDYPFRLDRSATPALQAEWSAMAVSRALPAPRWRAPAADLQQG